MDNNEEIKIQTAGERAMALIKDEVELEKLKEELALFEKEKKELEEWRNNRRRQVLEVEKRHGGPGEWTREWAALRMDFG